MDKLRLLQLQLGLFFEDIESRPDRFISKMSEVSDNVFDQMPVILPIPNEAPPEIPVVIMNSQDGLYTCNISKVRIDFIANLANFEAYDISSQLKNFIDKMRPYASIVFGYKKIVRFGFVAQYFYKSDEAIDIIQSKYIKTDLCGLEELNIRYNKRFNSNNLFLNNVVELSKGLLTQNQNTQQVNHNGIIIQRDINNVPTGEALPIEDVFSLVKSKSSDLGNEGIMELLK